MIQIVNFGSYELRDKRKIISGYLNSDDLILFSYQKDAVYIDEDADFDFELYCLDAVYYNNEELKVEIEKEIIELIKDYLHIDLSEAKRFYFKLKDEVNNGDNVDIDNALLEKIKNTVYISLRKKNIDRDFLQFVNERKYGETNWNVCESIIQTNTAFVWYIVHMDELSELLKINEPCTFISLKTGDELENFSMVFIIEETASDYDLLIFNKDELKHDYKFYEKLS